MAFSDRQPVIVGIHNTKQARRLEGETSRSLNVKATKAALADAGLTLEDVDGVSATGESSSLVYDSDLRGRASSSASPPCSRRRPLSEPAWPTSC